LDQQALGIPWVIPVMLSSKNQKPPFPASIINVMAQGMGAVQIIRWLDVDPPNSGIPD